ncbi:MAG: YjbH domain-containing protein [Ignavibacteria bacterium]|jgi:hypothetical protein
MQSKRYIYTLILIITLGNNSTFSQTIYGGSGLFTIPGGNTLNDGEVNLTFSHLPYRYLQGFQNNVSDAVMYSASVGFLPFLEVHIRFTNPVKASPTHIGDRTIGIKLKMINENDLLPALTLGLQDFITGIESNSNARYFNSTYLVSAKSFYINPVINKLTFTLGYGTDIIDAEAYQFIGVFGGVELTFAEWIEAILEYDSEKLNTALKFFLVNHFRIMIGILDYQDLTGGIVYSIQL